MDLENISLEKKVLIFFLHEIFFMKAYKLKN